MTTSQSTKGLKPRQGFGFWGAVGVWTGSLVGLASINHGVSGALGSGVSRSVEILYLLPAWAGLFLPFCAFAGGLVLSRTDGLASIVKNGAVVVLVIYALLAFGAPIGVYEIGRRQGAQLAAAYPYGPRTPVALVKIRSRVEASPPDRFRLRIDDPFSAPPNWLTYLLHSPAVFALYSLLSILLGCTVARMTTGLSPPRRGHVRWAAGLGLGIVFFLAEAGGGEWVRSDPSRSGLLGAWLPLLVPGALLFFLHLFHRARVEEADSSGSRRELE